MAKKVIITADSTCDLSPELIEKLDVVISPLGIVMGDKQYTDGVDVTPDDLFEFYKKEGELAKTSAVSVGAYIDLFSKYTQQDCEIIHLSLSSKISSTHQNAKLAASELHGVYVVDTKSLCAGMGLLIFEACEMRDNGKDAQDIAAEIEKLREKVSTTFIIDTLNYLAKGGRCSSVVALGANLLSIKPSLRVKDGAIGVDKKYRGKIDVAYKQYIRDQLSGRDDIDLHRVIIGHSGLPQEKIDMLVEQVRSYADFKEVYVIRAGCTISAHCGPGTAAVFFMTK